MERDCSALAALLAATALLGGGEDFPLLDDEEQPVDFDVALELIQVACPRVDKSNVHRILGLLFAASGSEIFEDPDHMERFVGAIVYGDPYRFEEDQETPLLVEITWALYQVDALLEESVDDLLSEEVGARIAELVEDSPLDVALLQAVDPDFTGSADEFYALLLDSRLAALEEDLKLCGLAHLFEENTPSL